MRPLQVAATPGAGGGFVRMLRRALLSILALAALVAVVLVVRRPAPPDPVPEASPPPDPAAEEARQTEVEALEAVEEEGPEVVSREEISPPPATVEGGTSVRAPPPDSAPVRGRLTDELTGEPLPFYALQVRDSTNVAQEVTTDEDGRFATAAALPAGIVRFRFVDSRAPRATGRVPAETMREQTVVDGAAPEIDLAVASGPTFHLRILPAEAPPPPELLGRLRVANRDAKGMLDPERLRVGVGTGPLGEAPWVRFGPVPEQFDRAESVRVESADGLWTGEAKVSAIRGDAPGILPLVLEQRAVLLGKVVDPEGKPIAGARVRLEGTSTGGNALGANGTTASDGSYRFPLLAEGTGTVAARSLLHRPLDADVRLVAGSSTIQDFVLETLPPAGEIRGRVESRTGTFDPRLEITLVPIDTPAWTGGAQKPRLTSAVSWSTVDGRRVGTFEFGEFPAGRYEIAVREKGYLRWDPDRTIVSPPSTGTVFLVQDDLPNADFVFRVRDADDGSPLDGVQVSIQHTGRGGAPWSRPKAGAPVLQRFPLDRDFRWRLDLDGYRTATGDEKAFGIEETEGTRVRRIAEVELRRGWGEVFRVMSKAKNRPIAGATVRLDGKDAGTTAADGLVLVDAPLKPSRVEVVYRDWTLVSPLDLRAASKRREKRWVTAVLAPPAAR